MNKKTTGIVAYLTWVGLLIAFLAGDTQGAKFHLNQALVLWILALAGFIFKPIPLIGGVLAWAWSIALFICWLIGFIGALNDEEREIPILGCIKILK